MVRYYHLPEVVESLKRHGLKEGETAIFFLYGGLTTETIIIKFSRLPVKVNSFDGHRLEVEGIIYGQASPAGN